VSKSPAATLLPVARCSQRADRENRLLRIESQCSRQGDTADQATRTLLHMYISPPTVFTARHMCHCLLFSSSKQIFLTYSGIVFGTVMLYYDNDAPRAGQILHANTYLFRARAPSQTVQLQQYQPLPYILISLHASISENVDVGS
jgi:hypothetical protein